MLPREKDKAQRLCEIVPDNSRKAYDVKEVIDCIADDGSFFEIQKEFAANAVIGLGRMEGESIGFVANQPGSMGGSLDYHASDKIARFRYNFTKPLRFIFFPLH